MRSTLRIGVGFATIGYAVVGVLGLLPPKMNISPVVTLSCAPVLLLTATVDPSWTTLLLVLAPLNAVLYGGIAIMAASAISDVVERHKTNSPTR